VGNLKRSIGEKENQVKAKKFLPRNPLLPRRLEGEKKKRCGSPGGGKKGERTHAPLPRNGRDTCRRSSPVRFRFGCREEERDWGATKEQESNLRDALGRRDTAPLAKQTTNEGRKDIGRSRRHQTGELIGQPVGHH